MWTSFVPVLALASLAPGQPPKKTERPQPLYLVPLTVHPGFTGKRTVRGLNLETITAVTSEAPTVTIQLAGKGRKAGVPNNFPSNRCGDTEIDLEISIPRPFRDPTVKVRLTGPGGISEPLDIPVRSPGTAEIEPNGGFREAQVLTLPAILDGVIAQPRDVDVFRIAGRRGTSISVDLLARAAGSPADLMLTVYDPHGRIIPTRRSETEYRFIISAEGDYKLAILDANDTGGPSFVYHLEVVEVIEKTPPNQSKP